MIVEFTLSLPEHTTIIDHYDDIFGENVSYEINWDYPVLPRVGEYIDGHILNEMINGVMKDNANLPVRWHITDIKWMQEKGVLFPLIHAVGKWGAV